MPRFTVSSLRKSLYDIEGSITTHASDSGGYATDATMPTLPPSYKTCRAHPDLPGCSLTDGHLSLPVTATSNAEQISILSSVYMPPGRRRSSGLRFGTYNVALSSDSEPSATQGGSCAIHLQGIEAREYPRKSMDSGVRLTGGPLGEAQRGLNRSVAYKFASYFF